MHEKKLVYLDDRFLKQHCAHLIVRRVSRFEVVAFRARVFEERHWELNKLTSTTVVSGANSGEYDECPFKQNPDY